MPFKCQQTFPRTSPNLVKSDIIDWLSLCKRLRDESEETQPNPGKRMMQLLPQETQAMILSAARTNSVSFWLRFTVITDMNEILKRPDFYRAEDFERVISLDTQARFSSAHYFAQLDEDVVRCNRLLLEESWPKEVEILKDKRCREFSWNNQRYCRWHLTMQLVQKEAKGWGAFFKVLFLYLGVVSSVAACKALSHFLLTVSFIALITAVFLAAWSAYSLATFMMVRGSVHLVWAKSYVMSLGLLSFYGTGLSITSIIEPKTMKFLAEWESSLSELPYTVVMCLTGLITISFTLKLLKNVFFLRIGGFVAGVFYIFFFTVMLVAAFFDESPFYFLLSTVPVAAFLVDQKYHLIENLRSKW